MSIAQQLLQSIVEAALLAANKPLTLKDLLSLFEEDERPDMETLFSILELIKNGCDGRGFELVEVASGYRFQVKSDLSHWVNKLWEEKPQKYSRATLETLALIAYRQPITRTEIEQIRGVAVSSQIMRALMDRSWIRIIGHKEVPGRPAMYTTKVFLDYFNLKSLDQLPTLNALQDLEVMDALIDEDIQDESEANQESVEHTEQALAEPLPGKNRVDGGDEKEDALEESEFDSDEIEANQNDAKNKAQENEEQKNRA